MHNSNNGTEHFLIPWSSSLLNLCTKENLHPEGSSRYCLDFYRKVEGKVVLLFPPSD